jgi:hypothetical protein
MTVYGALALSLFWVLTMWNVWEKDVSAFGWNLSVFILGAMALFAFASGKRTWQRADLLFLAPLGLIAVSFALYENPYIKLVNCLVVPLLFAGSWIVSSTRNSRSVVWNISWLRRIVERFVGILGGLGAAVLLSVESVLPSGNNRSDLHKRIAIGLVIFAAVACFIFIPLLSDADARFAELVRTITEPLLNVISVETLVRFCVFVVLALALLAGIVRWTKEESYTSTETKKMDSVVSGIVLGGVLGLYILFLMTQVSSLWVRSLPTEFLYTEKLVKTGFWELFFLSGINTFLFLIYYRRTARPVQHILVAFMVASLFLLFSAANRMGMYVYYYGFSYEKFFALYTVLFAILLFIRLIAALFQKGKPDMVKFIAVAFVWMYAVTSVFPVEQTIFRLNRRLAALPGSRINMIELQMLSSDVYGLALEENVRADTNGRWLEWLENAKETSSAKEFYEMNWQDVLLRNR